MTLCGGKRLYNVDLHKIDYRKQNNGLFGDKQSYSQSLQAWAALHRVSAKNKEGILQWGRVQLGGNNKQIPWMDLEIRIDI